MAYSRVDSTLTFYRHETLGYRTPEFVTYPGADILLSVWLLFFCGAEHDPLPHIMSTQ
jgi:hypothetical protein